MLQSYPRALDLFSGIQVGLRADGDAGTRPAGEDAGTTIQIEEEGP